ncbi:MAG: hypothetical protein H7Z14_15780, partial [Anaerolineae bacterium]|nr:hypothetical protein [Phycisphaerae bacterium]
VAIIYGSLCYLFVRFFIYLLLWLSHEFAGLWFVYPAENAAPLFNVMWTDPYANGRLVYEIDWLVLTPMQSIGATLLAFWVYLTISMLGAFAISFYFSANTVIYYLMRNEVDATELDDVYLEQSDEEFTDTVTTTTVTTETTTTEAPAAPAASEVPPSEPPPPAAADEAPPQ